MKIGNYKNLNVGKKECPVATPEEVAAELNRILASKVTFVEKAGKSALGDTVNIDYKGLLDGVAFAGGTAEKYDLTLGSNSFIPGFEDQLVGYEAGADVDVNVTFPEQYHAPELAGKAVVFKCHIHAVKEKSVPELNDEFAASLGAKSLDELKKAVEHQMNLEKKNEADNQYLGALMNLIIADSEVEVDEKALSKRVDEMVDYYSGQVAQYGMQIESYLQMQGMTMETFRDQLSESASVSLKGDVIFDYIGKQENISVKPEELQAELDAYKNYYQMTDEQYTQFVVEKREALIDDLQRKNVALFLIENNN